MNVNASAPNLNTNLAKPDEVLTESAAWGITSDFSTG
jgi:hypothetical protein